MHDILHMRVYVKWGLRLIGPYTISLIGQISRRDRVANKSEKVKNLVSFQGCFGNL